MLLFSDVYASFKCHQNKLINILFLFNLKKKILHYGSIVRYRLYMLLLWQDLKCVSFFLKDEYVWTDFILNHKRNLSIWNKILIFRINQRSSDMYLFICELSIIIREKKTHLTHLRLLYAISFLSEMIYWCFRLPLYLIINFTLSGL